MLKLITGLVFAGAAVCLAILMMFSSLEVQVVCGALLALLLLFCIYSLFEKGFQRIPEQERWNVEYFGKYIGCLDPGLHLIFPWFEKCPEDRRVPTWVRKLQLFEKPIKADLKDGAASPKDAWVYVEVNLPKVGYTPNPLRHDPPADPDGAVYKAAYAIENRDSSVKVLLENAVRSYLNSLTIQEALVEGKGGFDLAQQFPDQKLKEVKDQLAVWGLRLVKITIGDFDLDEAVLKARDSILESNKATEASRILIQQAVAETTDVVFAQFISAKGFKDVMKGKKVTLSAKDQAVAYLDKPENSGERRRVMEAIHDLLVRRQALNKGALQDFRGLPKRGIGLESAVALYTTMTGKGGNGGGGGGGPKPEKKKWPKAGKATAAQMAAMSPEGRQQYLGMVMRGTVPEGKDKEEKE